LIEGKAGDWRELAPRRASDLKRGVIGVDHRIGQAARARDNRQRAIAQAVKLCQTARFEP